MMKGNHSVMYQVDRQSWLTVVCTYLVQKIRNLVWLPHLPSKPPLCASSRVAKVQKCGIRHPFRWYRLQIRLQVPAASARLRNGSSTCETVGERHLFTLQTASATLTCCG